jgi:hypothetical protein
MENLYGCYAGDPILVSDSDRSGTQQSDAGLAREELTAGTFVTVSENKRAPADRSLGCAIWEVIGHNETHVVLRLHSPPRPLEPIFPTYVVPLHEHDFYRADDLAAVVEATSKRPCASIVRLRDC